MFLNAANIYLVALTQNSVKTNRVGVAAHTFAVINNEAKIHKN